MANGLFSSMLGFNPVDLQQKRMQQFLAPIQQAQNPYEKIGAALGTIGGGALFGIEDPQLQRASKIRGIMDSSLENVDMTDPTAYKTSLLTLAQNLKDAGETDAALYAINEAAKIKDVAGGKITLSVSDLEKIVPEDRQRAITAYQKTNKIPPDIRFIGAVDKPKEQRDALKFIRENPEQSTFVLQDLAKRIEANPQDTAAIREYEQVATAASEGSIDKYGKAKKEELGSEIDKLRLLDYKNKLNESATLTQGARYNNEIDAARDLLKVYEIDVTKPLEGQVKSKVLYGPLAAELTKAYERALRKKTNEGGKASTASSTPSASKQPDPVLTTALQSANIPYEPEKYDYRVVNGTVQRKIKGK